MFKDKIAINNEIKDTIITGNIILVGLSEPYKALNDIMLVGITCIDDVLSSIKVAMDLFSFLGFLLFFCNSSIPFILFIVAALPTPIIFDAKFRLIYSFDFSFTSFLLNKNDTNLYNFLDNLLNILVLDSILNIPLQKINILAITNIESIAFFELLVIDSNTILGSNLINENSTDIINKKDHTADTHYTSINYMS